MVPPRVGGKQTGTSRSPFPLQLLPESCVDAMELLSYLDPPDLGGGTGGAGSHPGHGAGTSGTGAAPGNDDLLALFEP